MPLIKRRFSTLYSQIDDAVNRIEDYDALIEVTIKDNRRALAQANIHLDKVRDDGKKLIQQLKTHIYNGHKWQQRARACTETMRQQHCRFWRGSRKRTHRIQVLETALAQHQTIDCRDIPVFVSGLAGG